jgi:small ligand-binding sensory domain FIST
MYNDDVVAGTQVQLMRRRIDFDEVRARTRELMERLDGRRPVLALYADCWARRSLMCGTNGEDAEIVRQALGMDVPLLGFYVGSEITRVAERARATNYTGLLTILSE